MTCGLEYTRTPSRLSFRPSGMLREAPPKRERGIAEARKGEVALTGTGLHRASLTLACK